MIETKNMFLTDAKLEARMNELADLRFVGLTCIAPMTAMEGGLDVDEVYPKLGLD